MASKLKQECFDFPHTLLQSGSTHEGLTFLAGYASFLLAGYIGGGKAGSRATQRLQH